jgi:hypothetical protein
MFWQKQARKRRKMDGSELENINKTRAEILSGISMGGKIKKKIGNSRREISNDFMTLISQSNKEKSITVHDITKNVYEITNKGSSSKSTITTDFTSNDTKVSSISFEGAISTLTPRAVNIDTKISSKSRLLENESSKTKMMSPRAKSSKLISITPLDIDRKTSSKSKLITPRALNIETKTSS